VAGDDVVIEAFTELAPRYEEVVDSELRRFWGWSYRAFVAQLVASASVREGDAVLDVATGTAVIPRKLAEEVRGQGPIVGLDITLAMLRHGQKSIAAGGSLSRILFVCASAMDMPFAQGTFDVVICGLGTHHMDVPEMLSEMRRVLKVGGQLTIADVAASPTWRLPGIKTMLRIATFFYFLPAHHVARAWAEAAAVSNVHTAEEWRAILAEFGFADIVVTRLPSRHFWAPAPLIMNAIRTR